MIKLVTNPKDENRKPLVWQGTEKQAERILQKSVNKPNGWRLPEDSAHKFDGSSLVLKAKKQTKTESSKKGDDEKK